MESFTKQSLEAYTVAVEFLGLLPAGASLSSGTASAINTSTLDDVTDDVLDDTDVIIDGTQAQVFTKGGIHGFDYNIAVLMELTPGSPVPVLRENVLMMVRDL